MREVLSEIEGWFDEDRRVAVATVVDVWGSAPRRPGAKMAISSEREIAGSVSGGCVEGAVVAEAETVIETGRPKLLTFGVADEDAWEVGLSCGGTIRVLVEPVDSESDVWRRLEEVLDAERVAVRVVGLAGDALGKELLVCFGAEGEDAEDIGRDAETTTGSLGSEALDRAALAAAREARQSFASGSRILTPDGGPEEEGVEVLIEAHTPRPCLILVGAVHVAVHLVHYARELGFATYVVDPRSAFATKERFRHADGLLVAWPEDALPRLGLHENTYLAVLSHDPKIDLPALELALMSPVRYLGALGSKKTHARRVAALREKGFDDERIGRIHAPIGLELGGRRPAEIALAVAAQMVAVAHGADGR